MIKTLSSIFNSSSECNEHTCKIDKHNIAYIYKPDLGIIDSKLQQSLFGFQQQPPLCDCLLVHSDATITILEIKCGKVTKKILDEIIEQIQNVYRILETKSIKVSRCMFICKKFDNPMIKKKLLSEKIKHLPLTHKIHQNTAIKI